MLGFWRSTDGGVSWSRFTFPADGKPYPQDGYSVDVDPYDGKHLLAGFHEVKGMAESNDGGQTWTSVSAGATGISTYPFFIDGGNGAATRKTWPSWPPP